MADVTSSTGGIMTPAPTPAPIEDADLDAAIQEAVAAITEIPGALVRPRWQLSVPKQPEPNVDWCAVGVMNSTPDNGPALKHNGSGLGSTTYIRHEEFEVLASFYGPNSQKNAGRLRDGIAVPQNMESLNVHDIAYIECGPIRTLPELVNQQWVRRRDLLIRMRRKITRTYQIRNIGLADVHLFDDTHIDEVISVKP